MYVTLMGLSFELAIDPWIGFWFRWKTSGELYMAPVAFVAFAYAGLDNLLVVEGTGYLYHSLLCLLNMFASPKNEVGNRDRTVNPMASDKRRREKLLSRLRRTKYRRDEPPFIAPALPPASTMTC